jgi:hypothetical protein
LFQRSRAARKVREARCVGASRGLQTQILGIAIGAAASAVFRHSAVASQRVSPLDRARESFAWRQVPEGIVGILFRWRW